jgi:DNA-binding PadR family transcriptional regulator
MLRVLEASEDAVRLGPGTLYGALTKMLDQGLIARVGEEEKNGERRKLHVLTDLGKEVVRRENERLASLARIGQRLLKRKEGGDA